MIDRLAQIHNILMEVETKGQSTILVAECLQRLRSIISEMGKETHETQEEETDEQV